MRMKKNFKKNMEGIKMTGDKWIKCSLTFMKENNKIQHNFQPKNKERKL